MSEQGAASGFDVRSRRALNSAVQATLAHARLVDLARSCQDFALLPAGFLWIHALTPLPEMAAFYAALLWTSCASLSLALLVRARAERRRLAAALPETIAVARLGFAPDRLGWALSRLSGAASVAAGAVLCLHWAAPGPLDGTIVHAALLVWPAAAGARLACRCSGQQLESL